MDTLHGRVTSTTMHPTERAWDHLGDAPPASAPQPGVAAGSGILGVGGGWKSHGEAGRRRRRRTGNSHPDDRQKTDPGGLRSPGTCFPGRGPRAVPAAPAAGRIFREMFMEHSRNSTLSQPSSRGTSQGMSLPGPRAQQSTPASQRGWINPTGAHRRGIEDVGDRGRTHWSSVTPLQGPSLSLLGN